MAGKSRVKLRLTVSPWQVLIRVALVIFFLATFYPFFYVFSLAVMPYDRFIGSAVHLGPNGFTLDYFRQVFSNQALAHAFAISVLKTVIGTTLAVLVTTTAGWALSRPTLKAGRFLTLMFIIPMFIGGGLIPFFLVIRNLGLLDTFWALILPGMVASFNLLVVRSNFQAYPQEILDAARVDGAGVFTTFWRIVWPTSTPIIATIALLYGVGQWNDYFWPSILVGPNLQPAQVLLQNMASSRSVLNQISAAGLQAAPQSLIAAVAFVMVVPILIVYPFVQRFVVRGIMIGSVKG